MPKAKKGKIYREHKKVLTPRQLRPAPAQQSAEATPKDATKDKPAGEVAQLRARIADLEAATSPAGVREKLEPHLEALFVEACRDSLVDPKTVLDPRRLELEAAMPA
jgi:hypothetical protein